MLFLFACYRRIISGIIPLEKGKPPIYHYHQGKVFFYFNVLFNLTRAHFPLKEKV